jgi:hypothetical protein
VAHALGRLVEHLGPAGERHRHLEAALLAVRELRDRKPGLVRKAESRAASGRACPRRSR